MHETNGARWEAGGCDETCYPDFDDFPHPFDFSSDNALVPCGSPPPAPIDTQRPSKAQTNSFMPGRLPPEIRRMIYDFVFISDPYERIDFKTAPLEGTIKDRVMQAG